MTLAAKKEMRDALRETLDALCRMRGVEISEVRKEELVSERMTKVLGEMEMIKKFEI